MSADTITKRVNARIGLLGNPSDSYYGKTISLSLENFFAEVSFTTSSTIRITSALDLKLLCVRNIR
jgi:glucuronokinase